MFLTNFLKQMAHDAIMAGVYDALQKLAGPDEARVADYRSAQELLRSLGKKGLMHTPSDAIQTQPNEAEQNRRPTGRPRKEDERQ